MPAREFDYQTHPAKLDPEKLLFALPDWTFQEKSFRLYRKNGLDVEDRGWIFNAPDNIVWLELERDGIRRATLHFDFGSLTLWQPTTIGMRSSTRSSLVEINNRTLSLVVTRSIVSEKPWYEVDLGPKESTLSFNTKLQIQSGFLRRVTQHTTLEELTEQIK